MIIVRQSACATCVVPELWEPVEEDVVGAVDVDMLGALEMKEVGAPGEEVTEDAGAGVTGGAVVPDALGVPPVNVTFLKTSR